MTISNEQPPVDTDPELASWLGRMFNGVSIVLGQSHQHPERKEMPYKPQFGDIHYFGDPTTHTESYDPAITSHGLWAFIEILPATDPRTGEWIKLS